jgi:hypothetical protein
MKRVLSFLFAVLIYGAFAQQNDSLLSAKPYYNPEQIALDRMLRQKIYEHVNFCLSRTEAFSDSVAAICTDAIVRENLLTWKIAFSEALLSSALQPDAVRSALDLRVFSMQHTRYFTTGLGKGRLGEYSNDAVKVCIEMERSAIRLMDIVLQDGGKSQATLTLFEGYAESNKLDNHYFIRSNSSTLSDQITSEGKTKMKTMASDMAEQVNVLSERLNLYMAIMPRLAMWRSERMMQHNTEYGPMAERMDSIEAHINTMLGMLHDGMPWVPELMDRSLAHLTLERLEMQKFMMEERKIAFKEIDAQRQAMMQDMRVFRDETMDILFNESYSGFSAGEHYASRFLDGIFIRLAGIILLFGLVLTLALRIGLRKRRNFTKE